MVHEDQQHDWRQKNGKKGPFYEIDQIHSSGSWFGRHNINIGQTR
jgi:hypothetical protein